MRRSIVFFVISLLLGGLVNPSIVQASTQDPYEEFWEILWREARLVGEAESGNTTAINELIENSKAGAENAIIISTQTWQTLQELKSAGVKLYYTEDELKEMIEEIKAKGLPQETVQALKNEGWSDEEIEEFEQYLIEHADEVKGDFNMSKFLTDFSNAFIRIAFKYNSYEARALELKYWKDYQSKPGDTLITREIPPQIAREWISFYRAYLFEGIDEKLSTIERLKAKEVEVIKSNPKGRDGHVIIRNSNFSIVFNKFKRIPIIKCTYWWNAIKAYNLTLQVESILKAQKLGNSNPELNYLLNHKVVELARALTAECYGDGTTPIPKPIITIPKPPKDTDLPLNDQIAREALMVGESEGILVIKAVRVNPVEVTSEYATYQVEVEIEAQNNAVYDINVEFDGTSLEDTEKVGMLNKDEVKVIKSTVSGKVYGSGSVTVAGTVKITYKSYRGNAPMAIQTTSMSKKTTERTYEETISLKDPVDPSKVSVTLSIDGDRVEGSALTFKARVRNDNEVGISGSCTLSLEVPTSGTSRSSYQKSESFNAEGKSTALVNFGSVTYSRSGTYSYVLTCKFGQHSKSVDGEFTVRKKSSGSLGITTVTITPNLPRAGEIVTFKVEVKNSYSSGRNVSVKLFIDDVEVDSTSAYIPPDSTKTLTLQWSAEGGEHSYEIKLYNQGVKVEEKKGELNVSSVEYGLSGWLEVVPNPIEAGNNVSVIITVKNSENYKQTLPIELVDDTGNVWWPHEDYYGVNYSISNGYLTIYANKTARITATIGPLTQNTTLILKIGGRQMASEDVKVLGRVNWLELSRVSCNDLVLKVGGTLDYKGTATCVVELRNPTRSGVAIELDESRVLSIDFPMDHSNGVITLDTTTTIKAGETGNVYITFKAWTSDFTAFARYWLRGYYHLPVTIEFELKMSRGNNFEYSKYEKYKISTQIQVKTSDTIYLAVSADIGSFFTGGEGLRGIVVAFKEGKRAKTVWEIFKVAQAFIRGILKKW
ncbi:MULTISPECIES: hypothetical protein [Pyrococcus]|uniref:CARDB domain-containing protein n=1 Tax=Pyrococcus furiosus COM1 TaxID=1185654 RepID=I6V3E2_9EURY|nr:hypothetical protein [Pyrococcus furiosus]AFN04658.1 hypothetical protein PFC_08665 [Pyrococcus furiosus COM1]